MCSETVRLILDLLPASLRQHGRVGLRPLSPAVAGSNRGTVAWLPCLLPGEGGRYSKEPRCERDVISAIRDGRPRTIPPQAFLWQPCSLPLVLSPPAAAPATNDDDLLCDPDKGNDISSPRPPLARAGARDRRGAPCVIARLVYEVSSCSSQQRETFKNSLHPPSPSPLFCNSSSHSRAHESITPGHSVAESCRTWSKNDLFRPPPRPEAPHFFPL